MGKFPRRWHGLIRQILSGVRGEVLYQLPALEKCHSMGPILKGTHIRVTQVAAPALISRHGRSGSAMHCTCHPQRRWVNIRKQCEILKEYLVSLQGTNENKQQIPQVETQNQYRDCPLDKNELGRATWGLLHSISVTIPEHPTETQRRDLVNLMNSLAQFYPCEYCARDLRNE